MAREDKNPGGLGTRTDFTDDLQAMPPRQIEVHEQELRRMQKAIIQAQLTIGEIRDLIPTLLLLEGALQQLAEDGLVLDQDDRRRASGRLSRCLGTRGATR
jgi:hypothetical protein